VTLPLRASSYAAVFCCISLFAPTAVAQVVVDEEGPAKPRPRKTEVPTDLPRLVLETGRTPVKPAEEGLVRAQIHGEYQLRYTAMTSYTLTPTASVINAHPGAYGDSLGQNNFVSHWLRVTPRLQISDKVEIVGQMDLVTGVVLGDVAHDTYPDYTPRDDYNGFSNVQPRWLYADWHSPIGLFRVGQQPAHWGMGIVANDGDHPSLFGDYRYGNIVEQILFATKPFGEKSPFVVAVMGNLVFRDNTALLTRGDHAWQGVLAAFYEEGPNMFGVYGVYRHQTRDRTSGSDLYPYSDRLNVGVIDLAGHFAAPIVTPGTPAYVFGAFEAATILGTTNAERTNEQALTGTTTDVRSYGGAASVGFVLGQHADHKYRRRQLHTKGARPELYGKFVSQLEIGYASGDADPNDGVEKRFTFDGNHRVGLILFDEVMRFATARSAAAAQDPLLANGQRPAPGVDLLPSQGGVFGAQYVNPTMVYRPCAWFDLKGGAVIATTTADLVDPYRLATQGAYVNYRGGDSKRHDLGVELDVGTEARIPLDFDMTLQLGAQGGVLFPGGALADAGGLTIKTPWLAMGRAGLQF
jgi:hypothetical protein